VSYLSVRAFGCKRSHLNSLVDNAVDYAKRVEVQVDALCFTSGDLFVLLAEVIEELKRSES